MSVGPLCRPPPPRGGAPGGGARLLPLELTEFVQRHFFPLRDRGGDPVEQAVQHLTDLIVGHAVLGGEFLRHVPGVHRYRVLA